MVKPDFYIRSENGEAEDFTQCRLLMEVNANSFSYVLLNLRGMRPVVVKYFQLDTMNGRPLAEILQDIV